MGNSKSYTIFSMFILSCTVFLLLSTAVTAISVTIPHNDEVYQARQGSNAYVTQRMDTLQEQVDDLTVYASRSAALAAADQVEADYYHNTARLQQECNKYLFWHTRRNDYNTWDLYWNSYYNIWGDSEDFVRCTGYYLDIYDTPLPYFWNDNFYTSRELQDLHAWSSGFDNLYQHNFRHWKSLFPDDYNPYSFRSHSFGSSYNTYFYNTPSYNTPYYNTPSSPSITIYDNDGIRDYSDVDCMHLSHLLFDGESMYGDGGRFNTYCNYRKQLDTGIHRDGSGSSGTSGNDFDHSRPSTQVEEDIENFEEQQDRERRAQETWEEEQREQNRNRFGNANTNEDGTDSNLFEDYFEDNNGYREWYLHDTSYDPSSSTYRNRNHEGWARLQLESDWCAHQFETGRQLNDWCWRKLEGRA